MKEDTFREREKSYEAKYKLDEELKFKAQSRRNKLLGLWAAERMGLATDEAEGYAKEVVLADLEEPGEADVVRKLLADFRARKVAASEQEIDAEMKRLHVVALNQILEDYPEPLGPDHVRVGD